MTGSMIPVAMACLLGMALTACTGGDRFGPDAARGTGTGPGNAALGGAASAMDPAVLLGLPPVEIRRLLGPPAMIRRDGEAEIWRYGQLAAPGASKQNVARGGSCVLHVFFYPASHATHPGSNSGSNSDSHSGAELRADHFAALRRHPPEGRWGEKNEDMVSFAAMPASACAPVAGIQSGMLREDE